MKRRKFLGKYPGNEDRQKILISFPGPKYHIFPELQDPNPIIDVGFPRSVSGIKTTANLDTCLGTEFKIEPIYWEPFFNRYGKECRKANVVISIWKLPVEEVKGILAHIPFYINEVGGFLQLVDEILDQSYQLESERILQYPPMFVT